MQKEILKMRQLHREQSNASKCQMLTWRKRGNLSDRYVQNINEDKETTSNPKEQNTSITESIGKLDGGITESHGETRRQRLHLQHRSGQLHNGKRVGTHGNLDHLRNGGDFCFLEGIPENRREGVDRTPTHETHLCSTVLERTPRAWLKSHGLHFVFVRLKRICHLVLHMSHPCWSLRHPPFTTSKSSSSFTLPSTTTQEHEAQPVQQEPLREHPVHHAHLQAPSVDKLRHQESLWREDLQSDGNPRTTTPTCFEPKELATVSRIEDYSGDPYQLYDVRENWRRK